MSWNIGKSEYEQRATFWKIQEDNKTWATVSLTTSHRDKEKNWHNSNWGFVRFVGKAYEGLKSLKEKDIIVIKAGTISSEPYIDGDGKKQFPKNPQITVFAWEKYNPQAKSETASPDPSEESEFPF